MFFYNKYKIFKKNFEKKNNLSNKYFILFDIYIKKYMKIIINESQLGLFTEDLNYGNEVSHEMRTSIAIWCLTHDFRYSLENSPFGNKTSVANSEPINKEICADIMGAYEVSKADEEKERFGFNDYDDFEDGDDEREEYMGGYKIYKVRTEKETIYIEVPDDISEKEGEWALQDYEDGENDNQLIEWFYRTYR